MSKTLRELVAAFERELQCNCDLDKWEPERHTGHSCVCRIHIAAISYRPPPYKAGSP